jgi:hypothetical protein
MTRMMFLALPSHHSSHPLLLLLRSPAHRYLRHLFPIETPAILALLVLLQRLIHVLLNQPNVRIQLREPPHILLTHCAAAKGHQGQREDIARIQQKLSNASGPVSTLADRMGSNPWSKPAAPVGANNAAVGAPKQLQAAPEPQRKPLVLAPRTQPLPVFPAPDQPRTPAPAVFVSTANSQPAASSSTTQTDSAPVTPKPSTPVTPPSPPVHFETSFTSL